MASPLARFQAARGALRFSSLQHRSVELTDVDRFVLYHLDGSRDQAALLQILKDLAAKDVLVLRQNDQPIKEPAKIEEFLDASLYQSLRRLAASALLIG